MKAEHEAVLAAVAERDAPARSRALLAALRSPSCYAHPAGRLRVIETHISWVVLAGNFAYKIRKPVCLPFLDFRRLEDRRRDCEEELRLNRRTAPSLYLDVVAIGGTIASPRVGAAGAPLEYAVRMRRFAQEDLLDRQAREGRLDPATVDALALAVAKLHAQAQPLPPDSLHGTPVRVLGQALDNFAAIEALERDGAVRGVLSDLRAWTREEHARVEELIAQRRASGAVREGHGDLHLGNVVMLEDGPVPFDCLEFDPGLRFGDVIGDAAFAAMDLASHHLPELAARFVNAYLEATGDYGGLRLLPFFSTYRAMVRAKVACIRAHQGGLADPARPVAFESMRAHLDLARALSRPGRRVMILMHGISGSGKTTAAGMLLEALGAVRLRSDVERKRLHGLSPLERSGGAPGTNLYAVQASDATYDRLAHLAMQVMDAGYPVIVDATFLERPRRDAFRALASAAGAGFSIVSCEAPEATLLARLALRAAARSDASEADAAVLALQRAAWEPLDADEMSQALVVDTTRPVELRRARDALLRRL